MVFVLKKLINLYLKLNAIGTALTNSLIKIIMQLATTIITHIFLGMIPIQFLMFWGIPFLFLSSCDVIQIFFVVLGAGFLHRTCHLSSYYRCSIRFRSGLYGGQRNISFLTTSR